MKKIFISAIAAAVVSVSASSIPRDSNFNNTASYDSTRVEAQLVVNVDDDTKKIHFIRDNNDPRVITKTYVLKNVDAYGFRDYLRAMVQSKRVGNATLQQTYPSNTSTTPVQATVSYPSLTSPNAQSGYNPPVQLGSNTAVECLKYADGTGLLIVSAEEYRFADSENGMGIDTLVKMLDDPSMGELSYGSQMFIYMPKFVPAANLMPLIQNVGMNISDVTELWQGQDLVTSDSDLNWLIFDVSNYSCENISKLLAEYDRPIPQVRLKVKVYQLYQENDDKIGIDFQSWKNNQGADFFSVGGRYRNNWAALYGSGDGLLRSAGAERTQFYNFNPKWNTRYIDFLSSVGKAEIVHTGELCIRNNCSGTFSRTTQIFYSDTSESVTGSSPGESAYKLLSQIIDHAVGGDDIRVGKGNKQVTTASSGYGFTMTVNNASVNLRECRFNITLSNSSLIGFESNGTPRISQGNVVTQDVSLPLGKGSFVIGGLNKKEIVRSRSGIPYLCDIPYLGYLFSSVSDSVKNSSLIVVADCQWDSPQENTASAMSLRYTK